MNKTIVQTYCPVCKKKRSLQDGTVISSRESSVVVYNKCKHCRTASLAVISKARGNNQQLVTVETLTDLDREEAVASLIKRPLTADNVLEIYKELFN